MLSKFIVSPLIHDDVLMTFAYQEGFMDYSDLLAPFGPYLGPFAPYYLHYIPDSVHFQDLC